MKFSDESTFSIKTTTDILVHAVGEKIKNSKPEYIVSVDTFLKADADIDVFGFGDLLEYLFNNTQWVRGYEELIKWFAGDDCSIKELAGKIEYLNTNHPEN